MGPGNTPASAGKRIPKRVHPLLIRKYPRECGEEPFINGCAPEPWEIPPRVRGREVCAGVVLVLLGNTPASAGKRNLDNAVVGLAGKYPRECGEEYTEFRSDSDSPEIPPRVRGRASNRPIDNQGAGNTPASAGKSSGDLVALVELGKYPRECGEEMPVLEKSRKCPEIPPRVRGREGLSGPTTTSAGNTPASAGKRQHPPDPLALGGKYPRECGEEGFKS